VLKQTRSLTLGAPIGGDAPKQQEIRWSERLVWRLAYPNWRAGLAWTDWQSVRRLPTCPTGAVHVLSMLCDQDCLAVPGGSGHQAPYQLRCDGRGLLTLDGGENASSKNYSIPAGVATAGSVVEHYQSDDSIFIDNDNPIAGRRGGWTLRIKRFAWIPACSCPISRATASGSRTIPPGDTAPTHAGRTYIEVRWYGQRGTIAV
jgi:hypothetical protein